MKYLYVPVIAKTVYLVWHGTSDKHLHSILKEGLIFKPKKCLWKDSTIFVPINQGIYFTVNPANAINYAFVNANSNNANPILILASISMDQQNISLDEDEILDNCPDKLSYNNFIEFLYSLLSKQGIPSDRFASWLQHAKPKIRKFVQVAYTREERRKLPFKKEKYNKEDLALRDLLKEIGKLSAATSNMKNFTVTTPVKYKGSKRILAIFRLGNENFKQIYGDSKYSNYLVNQLKIYSKED